MQSGAIGTFWVTIYCALVVVFVVVPGALANPEVIVLLPPLTTGLTLMAPGAVIVTTLAELVALYPVTVQLLLVGIALVQILICLAISTATSSLLMRVPVADERICPPAHANTGNGQLRIYGNDCCLV